MERNREHPATDAGRPLTSKNLLGEFGARTHLAREGVVALLDGLGRDDGSALDRWKADAMGWAATALAKLPALLAQRAAKFGVSAETSDAAERLLLSLQTYYAMLVGRLTEHFFPAQAPWRLASPRGLAATHRPANSAGTAVLSPEQRPTAAWESVRGSPRDPFLWWTASQSPLLRCFVDKLAAAIARYGGRPDGGADGDCDLFKPLYQDLFPRPLRRQLGEYYTPDWLAEHLLDQLGCLGRRLLDPACGSGTFLVMAIRRLLEAERRDGKPTIDARRLALPVGFDLNPLAVMTAKANCLLTLGERLPRDEPFEIPVYLHDSIQDRGEYPDAQPPFDGIVGNPPWIAWDNLSKADRRATKPLWERYGLFSLSGNQARHGGGKKDLSTLMLYATADRYLKSGGRLGMVVTQTLFQTLGAGDGFRRFQLGDGGPPLRVLRVDDLTSLRPFGNATNWTSTIVLEKGEATRYPVPYFRWTQSAVGRESGDGQNTFSQKACLARPIDPKRPTSPWLVCDDHAGEPGEMSSDGRSSADYTAHLGANSGGANGVYWVEVVGETPEGLLVRNVAARGNRQVEIVEQPIEPDLLYPLLRWGGIERYRATPNGCILLAQDPATRSGVDETTMRARWPRTLAYLQRFRELLSARAAYRRYQQAGPFYSMYNVGPYTTAPVKVVWRRMDRRLNAAVVESQRLPSSLAPTGDGAVGLLATCRPVVPQETCVLVACGSVDEAHYLCALLNSDVMNRRVVAHSVSGGKSFGTPGMLGFLPLRHYRLEDARHRELAALSRQAHAARRLVSPVNGRAAAQKADDRAVASIQGKIDHLAQELWQK
ncbi:MAG: N-6 DNA methylase [Thermoguttaceae bacterium]